MRGTSPNFHGTLVLFDMFNLSNFEYSVFSALKKIAAEEK